MLLQKRASAQGCDVPAYLERLIERDINQARTLDEILAPVRRDFAESGMDENDLDALIENERQAMWAEKHSESVI